MSKKSLILVIIQFSCFAFFAFQRGLIASNFWLYIQVVGFIISLWGIISMRIGNFNIQPEVKEKATFITHGPYKIIRNPMYTGLILFFGASIISNFSLIKLFVFVLLVVIFLEKIKMEEGFLTQKFGSRYLDYMQNTYKLIPYLY